MADERTTVGELRQAMALFVGKREWDQFHSPKNLAMAMAVEVAELMEHFLWIDNETSRTLAADPALQGPIADEIADVSNLIFALCNSLKLDLSDAIARKMAKNELKYPIDKCRGRYRVED